VHISDVIVGKDSSDQYLAEIGREFVKLLDSALFGDLVGSGSARPRQRQFPLPDMCEALTVSISGYRAWRQAGKPGRTRLSDP
jgi:hypothetical protein